MTAAESLLCELRVAGVVLSAEGGRLRWTAPTGVMTADLLREAQAHKLELLAVLSAEAAKISGGGPKR